MCVYSRLIIIVESAVRVKRKELRGRKKKERNLIGKSCPTQEKRNTKKNETKNKNTQNNNFVFFLRCDFEEFLFTVRGTQKGVRPQRAEQKEREREEEEEEERVRSLAHSLTLSH